MIFLAKNKVDAEVDFDIFVRVYGAEQDNAVERLTKEYGNTLFRQLARIIQCATKARDTSGGRYPAQRAPARAMTARRMAARGAEACEVLVLEPAHRHFD